MSGSRDGLVKVWDSRRLEKPAVTMSPREGEERRDCWSVAMCDDRRVAAGWDNGDVKMFDTRNREVVWEARLAQGVCRLEDGGGGGLLAVTLEGGVHVLGEAGGGGVDYRGDKTTVWTGRRLPQDDTVIVTGNQNGAVELLKVGSSDGDIYIYFLFIVTILFFIDSG